MSTGKDNVLKRQGRTKTVICGARKIDSGIRLIENTEYLVDETRSNLSSVLKKYGVKQSDQKALDRNLSLTTVHKLYK